MCEIPRELVMTTPLAGLAPPHRSLASARRKQCLNNGPRWGAAAKCAMCEIGLVASRLAQVAVHPFMPKVLLAATLLRSRMSRWPSSGPLSRRLLPAASRWR
jgi:hypothetical protein